MNRYDNNTLPSKGLRVSLEFLPKHPFFIIGNFSKEVSWVFPVVNPYMPNGVRYDVINLSVPPKLNSSAISSYFDIYYYSLILNIKDVPDYSNLIPNLAYIDSFSRLSKKYHDVLVSFFDYYGLTKIK